MARRTSLAAVDLKAGAPAASVAAAREDGKEAQTLRLPGEYWHRAKVLAAMRRTTMVGLVQAGLDEVFRKLSEKERAALDL
jgi:hypothetical protein